MRYLIVLVIILYSCKDQAFNKETDLTEIWSLVDSQNELDNSYKEFYFYQDSVQMFFETNKPIWKKYEKSKSKLIIGREEYDFEHSPKSGKYTLIDSDGNKDVFVIKEIDDVKYNSFLYGAMKFKKTEDFQLEGFDEEISIDKN